MWHAVRSARVGTPSLVAMAVVAWAAFLVTAVLVAIDPPSRIDHDLQESVAGLWSDLVDRAPVLHGLSTVAGRLGWTPVEATVLAAASLLTVARGQSVRPLLLPVCTLLAVAASVGALKVTYHRPEPFFWLGRSSRSFPSGHSASAVAVYGGLALAIVLAGRRWWPARRTATLAGLMGMVLLVMAAMLVRSAHWISDIGGGAALGTAWLGTIAAVMVRFGWLPGRKVRTGSPGAGVEGHGLRTRAVRRSRVTSPRQ
jgi:membrane-associated phospholipid phosphatase